MCVVGGVIACIVCVVGGVIACIVCVVGGVIACIVCVVRHNIAVGKPEHSTTSVVAATHSGGHFP